jgi:hypothetical protein
VLIRIAMVANHCSPLTHNIVTTSLI